MEKSGSESPKGKKHWIRSHWWAIAFPVFLFLVIGIALWSGYRSGLAMKRIAKEAEEARALQEQFELGIEDLMDGKYDLAKQRADYILSVDPNHEGAIGLLDLALQALNRPTLTPTPLITDTPQPATATPDFGSLEGIFKSAETALEAEDWDSVMNLLIELRGRDAEYRLEDVNEMMFTALRNRGLQNILYSRLEQGIYDLTLAERFGPLDSQAASWRRSAAHYLFANSYIGLDWGQAYQYFVQLCTAKIWDSCYKFAISARAFGDDKLVEEDSCAAVELYDQSYQAMSQEDLVPTATEAAILCMTATAPTPTATSTLTTTATLTGTPTVTGTPQATPTATVTPTLSPEVTSTPTPSPSATVPPSPTLTETPTQESSSP